METYLSLGVFVVFFSSFRDVFDMCLCDLCSMFFSAVFGDFVG